MAALAAWRGGAYFRTGGRVLHRYYPPEDCLGYVLLMQADGVADPAARGALRAEAAAHFQQSVAAFPRSGWALLGLAQAHDALGHPAEATAYRNQHTAAWSKADVTLLGACPQFASVAPPAAPTTPAATPAAAPAAAPSTGQPPSGWQAGWEAGRVAGGGGLGDVASFALGNLVMVCMAFAISSWRGHSICRGTSEERVELRKADEDL